jgi:lipopolysaccharide transport system ATP-binding protein
MSDRDVVIRVENISKLYRLGEVGTGSLAHDVNRWWHRVRGKEDPYLKIGEVNDRTKPAKQASADGTTNHTNKHEKLTTEDTESTEGAAGGNQRADSAEFFEGHSQAGLQMDSEKLASIRSANDSRASGDKTGSDSESVLIRDIRGKKSSSEALDSRPSTLVSAPQAQSDWVYALKDVSFEVKRGEVLGIIGRNGAGKSTLLKILSRVTTQSSGQIKVRGRIASLLEVGTGFHPELTGRENIFLNGAILGMRKAEIARKFDEIVEFSGCARYIDTPVKRYSSGMYVRLAFAVAAHLEPEILIVDEVLAVGDAEFQKKCLGKMKDVAGHGRTILFVSHNMGAVMALCQNAIWLSQGTIYKTGPASEIGNLYLQENLAKPIRRIDTSNHERYPNSGINARIVGLEWLSGIPLRHGESARVRIDIDFRKGFEKVGLGLGFSTVDGVRIATYDTDSVAQTFDVIDHRLVSFVLEINNLPLNPGVYSIDLGCRSGIDQGLDYVQGVGTVELIPGPSTSIHYVGKESSARLQGQWCMENKI